MLTTSKILITGAAGSIGSALAERIALMKPKELICLDQDETGIFNLSQKIKNAKFFVADITNQERIDELFNEHQPDIVFHCAAYKHVPLLEYQIEEAIQNNVYGLKIVAKAAIRNRAEKFVFISTDKAVNPVSVMGTTKKLGELLCQFLNGDTKFMIARFGNVKDSRGSVIPTFRKLIREGTPIEITDPRMERYFMTMDEAVDLILYTYEEGEGGEVFVADMGRPVKIIDLAKQIMAEEGKEVELRITKPRHGEKLSEELYSSSETVEKRDKYFIIKPTI